MVTFSEAATGGETRPRGTDISGMQRKYREVKTGDFPNVLKLRLVKEQDLRYGENPNQPAALYRIARSWFAEKILEAQSLAEYTNIREVKSGKGGLSATNFMDITRAMEVLKFFDQPSVAVMKHAIPSGFATAYTPLAPGLVAALYIKARDADRRSAFGSVVVSNVWIDRATAEEITKTYVEVVAAPDFAPDALTLLEKKKDLRVVQFSNLDELPKYAGDDTHGLYVSVPLPSGRVVVQKPYLTSIESVDDLVLDPLAKELDKDGKETGRSTYVIRDPTPTELNDLLTAWYINVGAVRSNGLLFVKDGVTVAVGTGQQERVGAIEQAIIKAYQKAMDREGIEYDPLEGAKGRELLKENPLQGAVCSSDAFFPFRDSIDLLARVGVTAVIQPGGSKKDYEVITAANEHNMAMPFTLERCFAHF